MRKRLRWIALTAAAIFFAFVVVDSIGIFNNLPYNEVPHGNHSHYVPKDRDKNVPVGQFPTRPPEEGERITPRGEIVPIE